MKKLAIIILSLLVTTTFAACEKTLSSLDQVPESAKKFIEQHFPDQKALLIKKDGAKYEVTLNDGTELDFNSKGEWIEVDCKKKPVPAAIIPANILTYVTSNFSTNYIVKISFEHNKYEVELDNDLDLKFDKNGNFLKFD